jgi:hypothetical protein
MTTIAHGDININLNQEEAMAGLARIEGEFDATMAHISHSHAHAEIGVNSDKFDTQVDKAKAKLDEIDRTEARATLTAKMDAVDNAFARTKAKMADLSRQKAEPHIGLNMRQLDADIAKTELALKRLSAQKAYVNVEVREGKQALDYMDRQAKLSERRSAILRDTEKAAQNLLDTERRAGLETANHELRVINLKKRYADLTDQAEKFTKQTAYGREAKVKLSLASGKVFAEMEKTKAELEVLGEIPPVHVKVDTDGSFLQKAKLGLTDFLNKARGGLEGLGSTRINLGPISASLRGMILGASALAPIITSLGGSIVSLAGVLTTGLAGAASVAGGLMLGLATNFLGVFTATKNMRGGITEATAAMDKLEKAENLHGKGSKQAVKAQEELNTVLQNVSPAAGKAAHAIMSVKKEWSGLTEHHAEKDFGAILAHGLGALHTLLPGLAANTNKTMDILQGHLDSVFAHLSQPKEVHAFDRLGQDANKFLGPALGGLERFGAGFLHIGEAAAHIFAGPAGNAIKRWGQQFEQATQPGAKLDAEITRIGNHAKDVFAFFGAFGRLAMTVLNGAANSGDRLTNSMTGALNRYNAFLKTARGKEDMAQFFSRSVDNVKALASALGPLIAAFVQWSNLLAPFTSGLLEGVSFVSKLVAGVTKLIGLGGPMAALGATIGGAFAVSKIGAFVNMLVRAGGAVKALGAIGTIGKILSGGFGDIIKPSSLAATGPAIGESAAATMEAAAAGIGATIGEAASTAMAGGAAAAGAAEGAGGAAAGAGAAGAAGASGAGFSALAAGETAAATETAGLSIGLGAVVAGLTTAGGLALVLGLHFLHASQHIGKLKETLGELRPSLRGSEEDAGKLAAATKGIDEANAEAGSSFHQSNLGLKQLKDNLDRAHKSTREQQEAELSYNNALRENNKLGEQWNRQKRETHEANDKNVADLKQNLKLINETEAQARVGIRNNKITGNTKGQQEDERHLAELQNQRRVASEQLNTALNSQATVNARLARSYAGLPALTANATESLGRLARTAGAAGQAVAKAIAVKYRNPEQVNEVSAQSRTALKTGVSSTVVLKVIADASSAKQAIESLQRIGSITKHMDIIEHGGHAAVAMLSHIAGIHLNPKQVAILEHGGEQAISLVGKLIGTIGGLHGKNVSVNALVHGIGELQVINGEIARVHSTTATVTVRTVKEESTIHTTGSGQVHGVARHARGGKVNAPALLVGEENIPEYVIATNPAYRSDNVNYLREAAEEFGYGLSEAKKGSSHTSTPKTHAQPKPAHLQPPEFYQASAMPLGPIQEISQNLTKTVNTEKVKLNQLHESLDKADKRVKSAEAIEHRAKGKSKVTAHEHVVAAREEKHSLEHGIKAINSGGGSYKGVIYDRSLKKLESEAKTARDDLGKLENNNVAIEHWNSVVGTDQTKLSHLAGVYNGKGPLKGSPGVLNEWQTVKGDREHAVSELGKLLKNSRDMAAKLNATNPSNELKGLIDSREGEIATNETAGSETQEATLEEAISKIPSASEYAEATSKGVLPGLENAFALAQTNNVPDNPNTPENEELPTLADDLKAAQGLQGFWEHELSLAQSSGAPLETITDLANAVTSARSQAQGLERTVSEGTTGQTQTILNEALAFGSARLELYKNFGSNFAPLWTQPAPSVLSSPVGFQGAPVQQVTKNVEVNNHFSHPPLDPHSWSSGLSYELEYAI